jgi:hypothetical protein
MPNLRGLIWAATLALKNQGDQPYVMHASYMGYFGSAFGKILLLPKKVES